MKIFGPKRKEVTGNWRKICNEKLQYSYSSPNVVQVNNFVFEFPCIITVYYIKNQQDVTLAVLFISNCKITLHVSDAFCVHHQSTKNCSNSHWYCHGLG